MPKKLILVNFFEDDEFFGALQVIVEFYVSGDRVSSGGERW